MRRTFARHALRSALLVAAAAVSVGSTGCLCTFERDWNAAMENGIHCDHLAGLWEGTWESEHNGHHGALRAIITKCSDGYYRARYHATFAVCIPCSYDTEHTAVERDGITYFWGREDLGCCAGGVYHTNGNANGRSFVARYKADTDHGIYRMSRVGCCGPRCGPGLAGAGAASAGAAPVVTGAVVTESAAEESAVSESAVSEPVSTTPPAPPPPPAEGDAVPPPPSPEPPPS